MIIRAADRSIPLHDHPVLDSTNAEAKRVLERTDGGPVVVSAARQTAARGRFGRVWHSPENNLAMTLAMRLRPEIEAASTLALMTGLVLHDVLQALIGDQAPVRIKWPNDILVDDAKISGTLIERDSRGLYVGIGINLVSEPAEVMYPKTSLGRFCDIERLLLVEQIAKRWLEHLERWTRDGFSPIASAYTAHLWRLGEPITVALDEARTRQVRGRCLGVNGAGLLLLELPEGEVRPIAAGDVGA